MGITDRALVSTVIRISEKWKHNQAAENTGAWFPNMFYFCCKNGSRVFPQLLHMNAPVKVLYIKLNSG